MLYNQYKCLQQYVDGVAQDVYKKGDLVKTDDFNSLEDCEKNISPHPPTPPTPPQVETGFLSPISMDCYIYFPLYINPSGSGGTYTYCGYCELNGNILTIKKYKAYANGNIPVSVIRTLNSVFGTQQPFNTEIGERYNISQYSLDAIKDIKYEITVDDDIYSKFEIYYKGNYFYFTNDMYSTPDEDMAYFLMNGQCDNSYRGDKVQVWLQENGPSGQDIKTNIFDDKTFEVMFAHTNFTKFINFIPNPSKADLKNYNAYIQNGALSLMTIETK